MQFLCFQAPILPLHLLLFKYIAILMHDVVNHCAPSKITDFLVVLNLYTLTIPDFQLLVIFTSKDLELINSYYAFQGLGQES